MEHWVVIEDFPSYEVSSGGEVRNKKTGQRLKGYQNPESDVLWAPLRKSGQQHNRAIHRLVAFAFLDPPPDGCVPIHIDGDKTNNAIENLEWRTLSQARERTIERNRTEPRDRRKVRHIASGEVYDNALVAAKALEGLELHVLLAAGSANTISYKRSRWEFVYD